jgi:hypothetical protein
MPKTPSLSQLMEPPDTPEGFIATGILEFGRVFHCCYAHDGSGEYRMWFFDPSADLIVGPPPLRGQTLSVSMRSVSMRTSMVLAAWLRRACRRDGIPASRGGAR